jgi:hypothetical protein
MTHSILPALLVLLLTSSLLTSSPFAQTKADPRKGPPTASPATAADSASLLPVKRVVLYKNGVGYFEQEKIGGISSAIADRKRESDQIRR